MSKTLLATAVLGIALGAALLVRAYAVEVGRAALGVSAWYGPASPAAEQGLMFIGILLLATGLAVFAIPIAGRLAVDDRAVSPTVTPFPAGRRIAS
jgi:hypothetical protein